MERTHPVDVGARPIVTTSHGLSKSILRDRVSALSLGRVVVVGDLLLDELLEGKPERISREAPVLILEHVDTVLIPGGAANTAHNITALGGACHAVGVCGRTNTLRNWPKCWRNAASNIRLFQTARDRRRSRREFFLSRTRSCSNYSGSIASRTSRYTR